MMKNFYTRKLVPALLIVIFLSGCASTTMMVPAKTIVPARNYAVVNFLRPSGLGGHFTFAIWDRENFIGMLVPKKYVQYKAAPGEHLFLVRGEKWAIIKATVAAGRTYYVMGEPRMALSNHIVLTVLDPADLNIRKWMGIVQPVTMDRSRKEPYVRENIEDVRKIIKDIRYGLVSYDVMKPADGRYE